MATTRSAASIRLSELVLVFAGAIAVFYGVAMGALNAGLWGTDPTLDPLAGWGMTVVGALMLGAIGLVWALVCWTAALGLVLRQPWGRALSFFLGVVMTTVGCFPLGLVVVFSMLGPAAKEHFSGVPKRKRGGGGRGVARWLGSDRGRGLEGQAGTWVRSADRGRGLGVQVASSVR